eukprot:COSAG01_NODE_7386_length_3228_cov_2.367732_5_plen_150_part_00
MRGGAGEGEGGEQGIRRPARNVRRVVAAREAEAEEAQDDLEGAAQPALDGGVAAHGACLRLRERLGLLERAGSGRDHRQKSSIPVAWVRCQSDACTDSQTERQARRGWRGQAHDMFHLRVEHRWLRARKQPLDVVVRALETPVVGAPRA